MKFSLTMRGIELTNEPICIFFYMIVNRGRRRRCLRTTNEEAQRTCIYKLYCSPSNLKCIWMHTRLQAMYHEKIWMCILRINHLMSCTTQYTRHAGRWWNIHACSTKPPRYTKLKLNVGSCQWLNELAEDRCASAHGAQWSKNCVIAHQRGYFDSHPHACVVWAGVVR